MNASYLDALNNLQRKAVETTEGPLLIVAGAGTGKTKTLTYRILHIMRNGVPGENILGITFTNKAAREMRERVHHLLGTSDAGTPMLRTFHSLGVWILRSFAHEAGLLKHFAILDTEDTTKLIKEAMEELHIDPKENDPRIIRSIISREKGNGVSPDEFEPRVQGPRMELALSVWRKYEDFKKRDGSLDFDDLLYKTLDLLRRNKEIREHLQQQWRYIHVDEYQDTNQVQYELIKILADKHKNLCVVGDTDQNIYSWRGANIKNMLQFERDYPDATLLTLEQNYRSTQNILSAADAVISKNTARFEKKLRTDNHAGERIACLVALNGADEAYHIARRAKAIIESGVAPSEIAVLYRTNFQSRILEEAFLRENVPYHVLGTKFFERREIKDAVAYLRSALDPGNLGCVKRVINEPKRGLGPSAIAKIFSGLDHELSPKQTIAYADFRRILERIRMAAETKPVSEVIRTIVQASGFFETLRTGSEEDRERLLNLEELVTFATAYDAADNGLEKFLDDVALQSDQDALDKKEKKDAVRLMTVHAAKGLEFHTVFIAGLEQGLFPSGRSEEKQKVEEREEERRLFYVAITRAKEKLYLSYAHIRTMYGQDTFNQPSEFLSDIPVDLIEHEEAGNHSGAGPKTVYLDF